MPSTAITICCLTFPCRVLTCSTLRWPQVAGWEVPIFHLFWNGLKWMIHGKIIQTTYVLIKYRLWIFQLINVWLLEGKWNDPLNSPCGETFVAIPMYLGGCSPRRNATRGRLDWGISSGCRKLIGLVYSHPQIDRTVLPWVYRECFPHQF